MSKLENNTTSLQAILETVNNLPNASGGGSVETCNITLYGIDEDLNLPVLTGYSVTKYVDGVITTEYITDSSFGKGGFVQGEGTYIENVVCGSIITVFSSEIMDNRFMVSFEDNELYNETSPEGAKILGISSDMMTAFCKAPTKANSSVIFALSYTS